MTSTRPYLLRAFYDWIIDNNMTPYIIVNAEMPDVNVPEQYIEDGKIVLNISPYATDELKIANNAITFEASFSGVVDYVSAPIQAVIAIYARENGRGMVFNEEENEDEGEGGEIPVLVPDEVSENPPSDQPEEDNGKKPPGGNRPKLRIVK